jgi:hypothetical protein
MTLADGCGTFLAASPIISNARTTAKMVFRSLENSAHDISAMNCEMLRAASSISAK